jgi:hypothetical protein
MFFACVGACDVNEESDWDSKLVLLLYSIPCPAPRTPHQVSHLEACYKHALGEGFLLQLQPSWMTMETACTRIDLTSLPE